MRLGRASPSHRTPQYCFSELEIGLYIISSVYTSIRLLLPCYFVQTKFSTTVQRVQKRLSASRPFRLDEFFHKQDERRYQLWQREKKTSVFYIFRCMKAFAFVKGRISFIRKRRQTSRCYDRPKKEMYTYQSPRCQIACSAAIPSPPGSLSSYCMPPGLGTARDT
jgi:hypothetical protein